MKKRLITLAVLFIVLVVVAARPVSLTQNPKIQTGTVAKVYNAGSGTVDAMIVLKDAKQQFYINRGYEAFSPAQLQELAGKEVSITYDDGWTPLDH